MANKAGTKRRGATRGRSTTARGGGKRASTKTRAASHSARSSGAGEGNQRVGRTPRATNPSERAKTKLRRGPGDVGKSRGGAKGGGVPMRP